MTVDPYSLCPGGTGKKIKFCCSDLVSELDKIERMIEGDQRIACLELITKLEGKYKDRACLMAARSMLELSMEDHAEAAATSIDAFLRKHPENPVALGQLAVLRCRQGKLKEAMPPLLRAFELSGTEMHPQVYQSMLAVSIALLSARYYHAARAVLALQAALSGAKDERVLRLYAQLQTDPDVPLLVKDEEQLSPAPEGAPWKFEFDRAYQRAMEMKWDVAAEKFAALAPLAGQSPALWRNLAILRGWLADTPGMVEALRRLAALDIPRDEAIEAEAVAQLFDLRSADDEIDVVEVEFNVFSQTDLEERLAADRQLERVAFDPRAWAELNEDGDAGPPPRAIFTLLSRPIPSTAAGLARDQIPEVVGGLQLFGRQTDRQERLVVEVDRDKLPSIETLLRRIGGDALGERSSAPEEVVGRRSKLQRLLNWDWRIPKDATIEQRKQLYAEERRDRILNQLPATALAQLGGQTLQQCAADPAGKIRAAGFLLLRDSLTIRARDAAIYDELRGKLGLPVPEPIDPATVKDLMRLPAVRLHRLQAGNLDDDSLLKVYRRANMLSALRAVVVFGEEIARRPSLSEKIDLAGVHGILAQFADSREAAVGHIEQARAIAQKAKRSSAPWDLEEMRLAADYGDFDGFARLFDHIRREHLREEGVQEALAEILMSHGLVDSSGRVMLPAAAPGSPIVVPGAAAPSKILTPDGAAPASERKPVLWTPGME
ncbi:MAG TPA: hypothetical protein VKB78_11015 [Pirellulales bacterium]|nr:hypothetical protein [Pirellulales bacterium]